MSLWLWDIQCNFVLQQLHPNGTNTTLWQSFDYPSDTLIPTMKLGVNHKTGHHWVLVSWFTKSLETPGAFSLEWDPMEQELMIRRRGKVCWRSGKLKNNRFEHISDNAQQMFKYSIVSNRDENSFSFTATNEEPTLWWILSEIGQIFYYKGYIARADMCYGYNNSGGGCQRWQDIPKCRNPGDVFQGKLGAANYQNARYEPNTSYGYSDLEQFKGDNFYMLVNISTRHTGTKKWIWIAAVFATALLIICLFIMCLVLKKRKYVLQEQKRKGTVMKMLHLATCNWSSSIEDFEIDLKKEHDLKVFNYTSVLTATNGFSSENKLGQGGFGPVYKAWELWKGDACLQLVDPLINELFDPDEVQRCIHVGLLCVEHYANDRPTMSDIVSMLTNMSATVALPQRPAFYVPETSDGLSFKGLCTDSTTAEVTASTMQITDSFKIE
ncbi:hypothetical protein VNO78_06681 [Psophocarpus tetragonolobus]|uniref:Bulb-type lectin domain-containing protein n=1 Tax=Psophocarpus tetragonolobus TaxID=3891 RepID=A0AAN9STX7_PSOTE